MNVLLVGSGGREHALAWKLAQSPRLGKLWAAPGNAGIAQNAECVALNVSDHAAVVRFCRENDIALVVIGPEQPLVEGLADTLAAAGVQAFGPSRSEEHTSELQYLMRNSYAVLCLKKQTRRTQT